MKGIPLFFCLLLKKNLALLVLFGLSIKICFDLKNLTIHFAHNLFLYLFFYLYRLKREEKVAITLQ